MRRGPQPAIVLALAVAIAMATLGTSRVVTDDVEAAEQHLATPPDTRAPATSIAGETGGEVVLAFAGDIHFEGRAARLLSGRESTLGPLSQALQEADFAMVNLETAVTTRGRPARKELEAPSARYWFRTPPEALDVLARSGVDVASMANNHAGDFGPVGLRDALRSGRQRPVELVGIGEDADQAYRPFETTVNHTSIAVLAVDASPRESRDAIWAATPTSAGIAAARSPQPIRLLRAVRAASQRADIVVVYLHWGAEGATCATTDQVRLARSLADAGADVVVGAHSHTLLGSGLLGDTYVNYGLGNFLWYHGAQPDTGVLQLRFEGGELIGEEWVPGLIPRAGGPARALRETAAASAEKRWQSRRACTSLEPLTVRASTKAGTELPPFASSIEPIRPALASRMASSHNPAGCPVPLTSLRYVRVTHVDFNGRAHQGELVIHNDHATDIVAVFRDLYRARWPIQQMRLVSDYGGDDNASMAANNSSGYNCRTVLGQQAWSKHAYGAAVDINPVQNPYLTAGQTLPPAGGPFADIDRSPSADTAPGVIHDGDVVVRAFERIGWDWGGRWTEPDYQHFNAPE